MKKLVLIGVLGAASTLSNADQPLVIQQGQPVPIQGIQTPVAETQYYAPIQRTRYGVEPNPRMSFFAEYSSQDGEFANDISEDLKGFGIGISSSPHMSGMWGKFEYQENSEYDGEAYEFSLGGQLNLVSINGFYTLGTLGMGFSALDVDGFDTSSYFTLPVGLEVGYTFTPSFGLYGGIGYKWSWDVSSSTTCNNGTQSNSVGSGACSWNGGIDHYNYTVGDYEGVTYKAGLRYNF